MAELSDADKRELFGENSVEARRERPPIGSPLEVAERAREEADKMDNWITWAIVLGAVSALIVLTNYFGTAFPYNPRLEIAAGIVLVLAIIFGIYARRRKNAILRRTL
jgi:hypothetical protein